MPASKEKQKEVAERRARVLRLKASGLSYEAIAKQLNLPSAQAAANDAMRALDDRQALLDREAARFIALEMERLETMQVSMERLLVTASQAPADSQLTLAATDRLLRISQRRARLLGLDREVVGKPQPRTEVDELRAQRERKSRRERSHTG